MEKIILFGTGQMAQVVEYYIKKDNAFEICAYCMDRDYIKEDTFHGKPVVAFEDIEKQFSPEIYKMALPISFKHLNKYREQKYLAAKAKGYQCVSYISKDAFCETTDIGENVFILGNCSICPFVHIGNNVFMWPTTAIGHHVVIEDNCFLASPKLSGCVTVRRNCFLGTNATVADTLEIGEYCIVGGGVTVTKSIKDGTVLGMRKPQPMPLKSWEMEDLLG